MVDGKACEAAIAGRGGATLLRAFLLTMVLDALAMFSSAAEAPLAMLVMDPLAAPLACPCVQGHAQREYDKLGEFLAKRLDRPVKVLFAEDLGKALRGECHGKIDLIIGKQSVVKFDAAENKLSIRPLAMLTGKDGSTTLTGLFVVRSGDAAKRLADLKDYKVLFGPPESDEKHAAALAALRDAGVGAAAKPRIRDGCSDAALEVVESEKDAKIAAVISSYAMPLLEGCHAIEKGALRAIGHTAPVPFITAFATNAIDEDAGKNIQTALMAAAEDRKLLRALESKRGFVPMLADTGALPEKRRARQATSVPSPSIAHPSTLAWPGWRGLERNAIVPHLPERLPASPKILWKKTLTGAGLAGIAATETEVIVADRDLLDRSDIFRCLDASTGVQRWQLEYFAPGKLDYGNSPRATPLIHNGKVYLLGAFGNLHCLDATSGSTVWKKNIVRDYQAKLVAWGMCASPLAVDQRLIVNPGAAAASLVALDCTTGKEVWRWPGMPAAYASFIVGRFGGLRQVVGYDAVSLGGWNADTGRRLWTLTPPEKGDFNVPTPVALDGKLLVATENNGTRLYDFDECGVIRPKPLAVHSDLAPDASSPVVIDGKVFGCWGKLYCLDATNLRTLWTIADMALEEYVSIIGGPGRLLVTAKSGELLLIGADPARHEIISRLHISDDSGEVYSHPALVGNRLYLRGTTSVRCLVIE